MLPEILVTVAEEAAKHAYHSAQHPTSPRRNIVFTGNFFRVLISMIVLWLLGTGLIIFLKAFPFLSVISAIANVLIILASLFTFYLLWWRPFLAPKVLLYPSLLTMISSVIVFVSLVPTDADFLQLDLIWSFLMLIPASILFLLAAAVGRRHIFLANHAFLFSDEIEHTQSQSSNRQIEESAIEVVD